MNLRCPSIFERRESPEIPTVQPPAREHILGRWYIMHTSSPAWRDKRNVLLDYSTIGDAASAESPIDDLITYQGLSSAKIQSIHGIDSRSQSNPRAWTWRGTGLLKMISSHWEILGHGELESCGSWMVIYAQKSMLTPAVINVYTRKSSGLPVAELVKLADILKGYGEPSLLHLVEDIYTIRHD